MAELRFLSSLPYPPTRMTDEGTVFENDARYEEKYTAQKHTFIDLRYTYPSISLPLSFSVCLPALLLELFYKRFDILVFYF